jgi:hypothetical protein
VATTEQAGHRVYATDRFEFQVLHLQSTNEAVAADADRERMDDEHGQARNYHLRARVKIDIKPSQHADN